MDITLGTLKHLGIGLAVTIVVTMGAALLGLGQTANLTEWARNLGIAEAGAVGAFIVNSMSGFLPKPAAALPTTPPAP